MKARLHFREHHDFRDGAFAQMVIWEVRQPVSASAHGYKYRLAYMVDGVCVLRYDNESGKGDHRHWGDEESAYAFTGIDQLMADFLADIERWRNGQGDS